MEDERIIQALDVLIELQREILSELRFRLPIPTAQPLPSTDEKLMTRQEVKDYLGIGETTYKRKVKLGELKPTKMPGGDRFYKRELDASFKESVRRGRI